MMQQQAIPHSIALNSPAKRGCRFMLGIACLWICGYGLVESNVEAQPPPANGPAGIVPDRTAVRRQGMDRYDLRAAEDPGRSERLALVRKSFERQRWDEGVQQLQLLLNEDHDSLVFGDDHIWRPASEVALDLILTSSEDALRAYDARFKALAERDLKLAQQTRDQASLSLVARRYLLTTAGQLASRELIDAAIDQGNGDAVALLVRDLLLVDSPQFRDVAWRDQVIEILRMIGQQNLETQLLKKADGPALVGESASPWSLARFGAGPLPSSEWGTLAGDPSGQAMARVEDFSLLPRWRHSLVSHPRVRQLLREQLFSFEDEGALGLSVLSTVGSGDVLITRTLSNLTAVNAKSGEILWQSREWSPSPVESEESELFQVPNASELNLNIENSLSYRIRGRMTASGSLGTLSADARQLYALEHLVTEGSPLEEVVPSGLDESEGATTYLYARDLHTGRIAWRAGGPPAEEPPGLPAAGVFFFGPPTPDGEELFVVGEREGDILLFCLEAETGLVRWEQLLAAAGRRLEGDHVRRSWAAPVAVRGSLVICPTTAGWLTAVDRMSRNILWSVRLVPRAPVGPEADESELFFDSPHREGSLDERWPPLQPILLRDRVIVAPIELPDESGNVSPQLLCFDLNSGDKLWGMPKEQLVGVIGATEELVYLFDRFSVRAVNTSTGVQAWTCPIEDAIAGRPLLTPSGIVVPMQSGTMVRVAATDGKVIERLSVGAVPIRTQMVGRLLSPDDPRELSLGNLLSLGGRLISVSPFDMTAFEWKADEARWQAEASANANSSQRWAQSQGLRGQYADAARVLRERGALATNTPVQTARQKQTLLAVLVLQLEAELQGGLPVDGQQSRLDEARTLASSPADREAVQRLGIELALQAREWNSAWSQIREAIRQPLTFSVELDNRVVRPEAWLADQILKLGQIPERAAGDAMRATIRLEFQSLWSTTAADSSGRERLLRVFAETPFVDRAEFELLQAGHDPTALTRLQALTRSRDQTVADMATLRLIERLATPDWVGEARRRLALWPTRADWPEELRTARLGLERKLGGIADIHQIQPPSWLGVHLDLKRTSEDSMPENTEVPLVWLGEPCKALENFRYTYDNTLHCVIIERGDGSRYGELLLASNDQNPADEEAPILSGSGLNIYLIHMGIIHAYSVPEKRLLWQGQTQYESVIDYNWDSENNPEKWRLLTPSQCVSDRSISLEDSERVFRSANSRQLVTRTRRGIQVLDATSGAVQWAIPRCPQTPVRCDEDRLYQVNGEQSVVSSVRSGRPLVVPLLSEFEESLIWLDTCGLTTISPTSGEMPPWTMQHFQWQAERMADRTDTEQDRWDELDHLQLNPVWKQVVTPECLLGAGPPGQGIWVDHSNAVRLIEWATGRTVSLGTAALVTDEGPADRDQPVEDTEASVFAYWDRSQVVITTGSSSDSSGVDCPYVPVDGILSIHSRDRSRPDWHTTAKGMLLIQSLARSPFLPILHPENLSIADYPGQRLHLTLLDRQSGKVVQEIKTPSFGIGCQGCMYDPQTRRWRLYLPAERLQLQPRVEVPPRTDADAKP